jgi:hypothetical protein
MSHIPNAGTGVRKLNPHLYGTGAAATRLEAQQPVPDAPAVCLGDRASVKKRIRQSTKPLLNKLETEWLARLTSMFPSLNIHKQSWRVKLANGAWFKVDFCATLSGKWTAWEVKGPKRGKNVDRGMLALKCAVSRYSEINWILVWKDKGEWREQLLYP